MATILPVFVFCWLPIADYHGYVVVIIDPGDKPQYQCELCPTTCGRKTDLWLHVQKLHTSEKPMSCKLCEKSFPDRYTLKMHKKSHDGEKCFRCELCPYSSISQRHLESHMLIHTDQKPYKCDQCDQSFRQKQLLKRHQNLYHNPAYVPPSPKVLAELGTRQFFRYNVTMSLGHKVGIYCNITIFVVATLYNHRNLNIFRIFSGP